MISALAEAKKPLSQVELTDAIFGKKANQKQTQTRAIVSKVNTWAQEARLPQPVERAKETGYFLATAYQIIGTERPAISIEPPAAEPTAPSGPPESYSMKNILAQPGIAGVLSEPQVRRLMQKLVASGHLRVGEHVIESRAQRRGTSSQVTRDLGATPVGLGILRLVAEKFGAQGKIYATSVKRALDEQRQLPPEKPAAERFWGKQIVADLKHIGSGTLKTMEQAGVLKPGEHFEITPSGKRVYLPPAKEVAKRLAAAAAAAPISRISREFVLNTFGQPDTGSKQREVASEFPDYGPNGPRVFTLEHELIILDRLQRCERGIEERLQKPINPSFKLERDLRLGELTARLVEDESLIIDPEARKRLRREAAATVIELATNPRRFNFVRKQHPGLELALMVVKALDKESIADLADVMVNPPRKVADIIEENGLVNGIRTVGPLA